MMMKRIGRRAIADAPFSICERCQRRGQFSVLNRPQPNYEGHVPLNRTEKAALAVGSAVMSFVDPRRGDLIATLGEATATPYFITRLRDAMLRSHTGRRILRERPRITSTTLDVAALQKLPANTVGAVYAAWLAREGVGPDTRAAVRHIDDEECAYVMQRYRECHDFYHALTGLPVFVEAEVALKAFEFANTLLPMPGLSVFAALRLKPRARRRFREVYLPWALRNGILCDEIINVYWEEQLTRDADELRREMGLEKPPDVRDMRRQARRQNEDHRAAAGSGEKMAASLHAEEIQTST